jgi:hypothetical protein
MKKKLIVMLVLMVMTITATAQKIAVVYESGTLRTAPTLKQAVENATDGSVIYLPAGGFQIGDTVRIKHRVSIIGLNHKAKSENADGMTTISGNLFFDEGSSGSVVMGCYISGNVYIGYDDKAVHNIFVRYCNFNSLQVKSSLCTDTNINQCYIRSGSNCNGAEATLTHNVMHSMYQMTGGVISNNVFTGRYYYNGADRATLFNVYDATISDNVFLNAEYIHYGGNCQVINNMTLNTTWGDAPLKVKAGSWADVFENPGPGISSNASYHFKEDFAEYENKVGLYGGKSAGSIKYFHDDALPPVPYVQAKTVPGSTNFDGKLNVTLTVKDGNK